MLSWMNSAVSGAAIQVSPEQDLVRLPILVAIESLAGQSSRSRLRPALTADPQAGIGRIEKLRAARDLLLPRLMSGEIAV